MKHFNSEALAFFRGLAKHNAKPWFEAHREDYERDIKQPMADLVQEMDVRFASFAPEFLGDPKRSVFRLHRDIRFSSDKSPYKTHIAAGIGRYYVHLSSAGLYVGTGVYKRTRHRSRGSVPRSTPRPRDGSPTSW